MCVLGVLGVLGESERDLRENARVVCVVFVVVVDENEGGERDKWLVTLAQCSSHSTNILDICGLSLV